MEFEQILKEIKDESDVVGLILVGSRGKGFENNNSDYDFIIIVTDGMEEIFRQKYTSREKIDITVYSLSSFKEYADLESSESWNRYDFAHTKILIDKTGVLPKLLKEKGCIPQDKLNDFINRSIGDYINDVYRSVKCMRNGNQLGAHLEASNSILDLLTLVFAMEGRHRPFLCYVQKELEIYPLEKLPWTPALFVEKLTKVLETADLTTQQELLISIEKMCREMGRGYMFDWWKGKDKWVMTFSPE